MLALSCIVIFYRDETHTITRVMGDIRPQMLRANMHSLVVQLSPVVERVTSGVRILLAELLAIPFTQLCQCHSGETLKAVGPFYLVSMPGEVKDPTRGTCVTCCGHHNQS